MGRVEIRKGSCIVEGKTNLISHVGRLECENGRLKEEKKELLEGLKLALSNVDVWTEEEPFEGYDSLVELVNKYDDK